MGKKCRQPSLLVIDSTKWRKWRKNVDFSTAKSADVRRDTNQRYRNNHNNYAITKQCSRYLISQEMVLGSRTRAAVFTGDLRGQTPKGKIPKRKRSAPAIVERNLCHQCLAGQGHASRRRAGNVGLRANHWQDTSEDAIFVNLMGGRKQRVFNGFQRGFERQLREQQDLTDAANRVAACQAREARARLSIWGGSQDVYSVKVHKSGISLGVLPGRQRPTEKDIKNRSKDLITNC